MKKILFAMAALAALASCQKAEIAEQNSVNTNGERVITAYFDNAQTKTTLDDNGVTPKWTEGDKIMLLDETSKHEITLAGGDISSDGKSVTITTTLSGTLYAVYPSTATSAEKIETENIVPVTLPAEQDGTFGNANICVAKENDGSLAFKNVTSVLHLTQEDETNVNEIILTTGSATAYIAGTGTVDMSATTPALALSSGQSNKIKVKSASAKSDYYIAVAPTTLPAGTAFGFATGSKLGGTNLSDTKTIAANTIYNIGSMDASAITPNTYHEYVEIEMTVNSETKTYKWATMNIGATSATEAGKYFAWGDIIGQTPSSSTFSPGFSWTTCPFAVGGTKKFNKYVPASKTSNLAEGFAGDTKTVLDLADDAANVNWGGSWRMPTKEESDALCALPTKSWQTNYNGSGVNGYLFTDANGNSIFLPAAGFGEVTYLSRDGDPGGYWSSSLYTDSPVSAYFLMFFYDSGGFAGTDKISRYNGLSVRALSE